VNTLRVALLQQASDLDPVVNLSRLADLVPAGADLVVLPEAFARDFGPPGSDVSAFAEPVDGPFETEVDKVAAERGTTVVAGMFEPGEDPGRPFNTLVVRGTAEAAYRKIHLYDSFGCSSATQPERWSKSRNARPNRASTVPRLAGSTPRPGSDRSASSCAANTSSASTLGAIAIRINPSLRSTMPVARIWSSRRHMRTSRASASEPKLQFQPKSPG